MRHEKHRACIVEAKLKLTILIDMYDNHDELYRVGEVHELN